MSNTAEVVRLAAKGDGATAGGEHVSGALPGDTVSAGEIVAKGPHHVEPPCPHFGTCGGCQLQHADDSILAHFVRGRVVNAAEGQGLAIGELLPEHLSPRNSRRRATLHGTRTKSGAVLGFHETKSHRIVDLRTCCVLSPDIERLIDPLRRFIADYGGKGAINVQLSLVDQGVDCGLANVPLDGLTAIESALDLAREQGFARLSIDQGYGAETQWEPEPVTISLSGIPVAMPPGTFLQATEDAENIMVSDARTWLEIASPVADLFAGLGTFAFALRQGRKVLAVEADQAAHLACKRAALKTDRAVLTLHRDLFRNPLQADELNRFGAVLLDPPRAGAKAQIAQIAASKLERVVYVSCNPSSWARDAATLAAAGFKLKKLRPVGQFRWSTHVELISLLER